jgi:hypothetical protein
MFKVKKEENNISGQNLDNFKIKILQQKLSTSDISKFEEQYLQNCLEIPKRPLPVKQ